MKTFETLSCILFLMYMYISKRTLSHLFIFFTLKHKRLIRRAQIPRMYDYNFDHKISSETQNASTQSKPNGVALNVDRPNRHYYIISLFGRVCNTMIWLRRTGKLQWNSLHVRLSSRLYDNTIMIIHLYA